MFGKLLFITLVLAVNSEIITLKRSDTAAAPIDYSSQEYYNQYYNNYLQQQYRQEPSFLETIKTSIDGFVTPLLTIDNAILAVALAGFIIILDFVGIISFATMIESIQGVFDSRSFRVARMVMGDDIDQLADIVHNAIENVEKWKDM